MGTLNRMFNKTVNFVKDKFKPAKVKEDIVKSDQLKKEEIEKKTDGYGSSNSFVWIKGRHNGPPKTLSDSYFGNFKPCKSLARNK